MLVCMCLIWDEYRLVMPILYVTSRVHFSLGLGRGGMSYWAYVTPNYHDLKNYGAYLMLPFGSQAWQLDSESIKSFSTAWYKAIQKLLCLPSTTRSDIVPYPVGALPLEKQLFRRFAKMYNGIHMGLNSKNVAAPTDERVCWQDEDHGCQFQNC